MLQTMYNAADDSSSHQLTTPLGVISKPSLDETQSRTKISDPNKHDVLCGRGGNTFKHYGNSTYRELVNLNKKLYLSVKKKEKCRIAQAIVEAIRYRQVPNGRFLEKEAGTGLWNDIGDEKAVSKTSQALRENAPMIRKELKSSSSSVGSGANSSVASVDFSDKLTEKHTEKHTKTPHRGSYSECSEGSNTTRGSATTNTTRGSNYSNTTRGSNYSNATRGSNYSNATAKASGRGPQEKKQEKLEPHIYKDYDVPIPARQLVGDFRSDRSEASSQQEQDSSLKNSNAYQVSGSYDDDDSRGSEDEVNDYELINNMVDKMRSSFISHDGSMSMNQTGQRPSVRFAATTNFLTDVGEEDMHPNHQQNKPMSVRAAAAAAAAAFEDIDDDTLAMSTTGNGYRHEGRSSVRFSMDADTKEVLTAIAATRSAHRSSIYSAVSDVSFGFEDGDDFDDEHGARDDMSMSKASGHRGAYVTGDGDDEYYRDEQQDDDDYLEANYRRNNRSANQRRESTFSHGTMATAGTTGTAGTSGTMGTIQTVQMMEKRDSVMSSFSQFTFTDD